LSATGLNILCSETGEDAIAKSHEQSIDLILMDVRLPGISGYKAIEQIKEQKPKLKIVVQTAYASSDEELKAQKLGCAGYLSKPIMKEALLNLLGKLL
jgi:CheY-like chemotaxis protein